MKTVSRFLCSKVARRAIIVLLAATGIIWIVTAARQNPGRHVLKVWGNDSADLSVAIALRSINETTGTVEIDLAAHFMDDDFFMSFDKQNGTLPVFLMSGLDAESGIQPVRGEPTGRGALSSMFSASGMFRLTHHAQAFPLDKILVPLRLPERQGRKFYVTVENQVAGRTLQVIGGPQRFTLVIARSPAEVVFISVTSLVVLVVGTICAYALHRETRNGASTNLQDLLGIAGLLVGLASFRDIIRVSATPQFTLLEFVVLGVPIVALGAGLVRAWLARHRDPNAQINR
jgi:hypothetical protein